MKFELGGSRKLLVGLLVSLAILAGATAVTFSSWGELEEKNEEYKSLLYNVDHALVSIRIGDDPSGYLNSAESNYDAIISGQTFENGSKLKELNREIKKTFSSLSAGGETSLDELFNFRSNVSSMATRVGASIPLAFCYPSLIVLTFSISLAFLATLLCRLGVDWETLKEANNTLEEWKKSMLGAKRKKGKKRRKLELEDEERRRKQTKIWKISIKQAVFYLAPFLLFLPWLGLVYGEWTVAWFPFDWFSSGLLKSIGVSLGLLGWFVFTYFGFAWVWRDVLISEG